MDPVRKIQQVLIALALTAATLAFYSTAIRGGFIWDDNKYVTENPAVRDADGLIQIWKPGVTSQYYPITYTTFWLEYRLYGGFRAGGFHFVNVLLHAVNALLLVTLLKRLKIPAPWVAGAIFALHPVHVESVAWITERKNVLSGMFYLLSILAYLRFDDRRGLRWYFVSLVLYAAAMLSKTAVCALPVAVLLLHWYRRRRFEFRPLLWLAPFFAIGIGLAYLTVHVEQTRVGATAEMFDLSAGSRVIIASRALLFYAWKLLVPYPVIFIYPRWEIDPGNAADWWPVPVVLALAGVCAYVARRSQPVPAIVGTYFAASLFPILGFVNYFYMKYSFVADHFQYFASMGAIPFVTGGLWWALKRCIAQERRRRWIGGSLAGAVLLIFGGITFQQGNIYRDKETLWRATIARNAKAYLAYNNLGRELSRKGRLSEAEKFLRHAATHDPESAKAMTNLGIVLDRQNRTAEGEYWLRKAIEVAPTGPHVHFNLGMCLSRQGRHAEAIEVFREEIRVNDVHAGAYAGLGASLSRLGRVEEGIDCLRQAIEQLPNYAPFHFNLGLFLANRGRYAEAIPHFQKAVDLAPHDRKFREKLNTAQTMLTKQRSGKR